MEEILVVRRVHLLPPEGLHGFSRQGLATYLSVIAERSFFARRADVEDDPSLKQIIPYVVLRHRSRVFLVRRTRAGAEPRLRERFSIGLGGHITRDDFSGAADLVKAGMERELMEEVEIPPGWQARPVGVLNDDLEPVGRVHFGLVYMADLPSAAVRVRETEKLSGAFATLEEIHEAYDRLETWSQFVIDGLDLGEV